MSAMHRGDVLTSVDTDGFLCISVFVALEQILGESGEHGLIGACYGTFVSYLKIQILTTTINTNTLNPIATPIVVYLHLAPIPIVVTLILDSQQATTEF